MPLGVLTELFSGNGCVGPQRHERDDLLAEHARRHLAANKYPREITIVPTVPLTSVGKLDRKKLREWIKG